MTTNGQPKFQVMQCPVCLVCEKEISPGEKVIVSMPELIFIHLDCVESEDEAREIMDRHKETGGE